MIRKTILLGYPLTHSISPAFQQAALDTCGLDIRYRPREVPPGALPEEVSRLREREYIGANVTIPHKESVLSLVDAIDKSAKLVGAVNTIIKNGANLVGYNTDSNGFIRSLRENSGFDPDGKTAIVFGAGGAARAASFGLIEAGISSLTIINRTNKRARLLANQLDGLLSKVKVISMNTTDLKQINSRVDLIVNSTSLGMRHSSGEGKTPLKAEQIPSSALVYDMVYTPADTPLIIEARKAGARATSGLGMLVFQGAASFELWTGIPAPVDVMYRAAESALTTYNSTSNV